MDTKMSEAEQLLRQSVERSARLPDDVGLCPTANLGEWKKLISELDRLREFAREVDRIRESWAGTNEAIDLELREAIARAKGGEAT